MAVKLQDGTYLATNYISMSWFSPLSFLRETKTGKKAPHMRIPRSENSENKDSTENWYYIKQVVFMATFA